MNSRSQNLILFVLLFVSSLGLFAWWAPQLQRIQDTHWTPIPPELPTLPGFHEQNGSLPPATQSYERPLFWESRRPRPTQNKTAASNGSLASIELLGIVTEGTARVALLRVHKAPPPLPAQRLHVGDSINGTTIQSIDTDSVTLKSPNEIRTLKILRGSQGAPKEILAPQVKQTDSAPSRPIEQTKPPMSVEERAKSGSDELKKHMENLKRKAAGQAQPPATSSQ